MAEGFELPQYSYLSPANLGFGLSWKIISSFYHLIHFGGCRWSRGVRGESGRGSMGEGINEGGGGIESLSGELLGLVGLCSGTF